MFFRSLQGGGTNMAVQVRYFPIEFPVALGKIPNYRSLVELLKKIVNKYFAMILLKCLNFMLP